MYISKHINNDNNNNKKKNSVDEIADASRDFPWDF